MDGYINRESKEKASIQSVLFRTSIQLWKDLRTPTIELYDSLKQR